MANIVRWFGALVVVTAPGLAWIYLTSWIFG